MGALPRRGFCGCENLDRQQAALSHASTFTCTQTRGAGPRSEHFEIRSSDSGAGRDGRDGRRTGGVQPWVDGGRVSGAGCPQSCSTSGQSATFYCVMVPDTAKNHDTRRKKYIQAVSSAIGPSY